jgi:hypothetical protein
MVRVVKPMAFDHCPQIGGRTVNRLVTCGKQQVSIRKRGAPLLFSSFLFSLFSFLFASKRHVRPRRGATAAYRSVRRAPCAVRRAPCASRPEPRVSPVAGTTRRRTVRCPRCRPLPKTNEIVARAMQQRNKAATRQTLLCRGARRAPKCRADRRARRPLCRHREGPSPYRP